MQLLTDNDDFQQSNINSKFLRYTHRLEHLIIEIASTRDAEMQEVRAAVTKRCFEWR